MNPDKRDNNIYKIFNLLNNHINPNFYQLNVMFSLIGIALVAVLFTIKADVINSGYYAFYLIGMVILYVLIIFNTINLVEPLKQFLNIPLTKIIIAFFISLVFAFSSVQASIDLNSIFKVPASSFKTSMLFGTFLYFLTHLIAIMKFYVYLVLAITLMLYLSEAYFSDEKGLKYIKGLFDWDNWRFELTPNLGVFFVVLIFSFGVNHLDNNVLKVDSLKQKLFVLAVNYDFDSKNSCKNITQEYPVAYIGSNADKVLVNRYDGVHNVKIENLESFLKYPNYNSFNNNLNVVQEYFVYDQCIF